MIQGVKGFACTCNGGSIVSALVKVVIGLLLGNMAYAEGKEYLCGPNLDIEVSSSFETMALELDRSSDDDYFINLDVGLLREEVGVKATFQQVAQVGGAVFRYKIASVPDFVTHSGSGQTWLRDTPHIYSLRKTVQPADSSVMKWAVTLPRRGLAMMVSSSLDSIVLCKASTSVAEDFASFFSQFEEVLESKVITDDGKEMDFEEIFGLSNFQQSASLTTYARAMDSESKEIRDGSDDRMVITEHNGHLVSVPYTQLISAIRAISHVKTEILTEKMTVIVSGTLAAGAFAAFKFGRSLTPISAFVAALGAGPAAAADLCSRYETKEGLKYFFNLGIEHQAMEAAYCPSLAGRIISVANQIADN